MEEKASVSRDFYFKWLNSDRLTLAEKQKLKLLNSFHQEELFTPDGSEFRFGTSGIRSLTGPGPRRLNIHTCRAFAEAYAKFLLSCPERESIIIGYDNREHGRKFAETIYKVLEYHAIPAIISSTSIATPVLAFYIQQRKLKGGVMITASHNPQEYNGFKLYGPDGGQLSTEQETLIRSYFPEPENYLKINYSSGAKFESLDQESFNKYSIAIAKEIQKRLGNFYFLGSTVIRTIKFLFSSHHGTSSGRMTSLAKNMGAQKFKEYYWECTPTSSFSNSEITNPEDPKSFRDMARAARTLETDYLIAHDPDSDRSAIAEWTEDKWYYFTGNEIAVLLAYFLLELSQSSKYGVQIKYKYLVTTYVSGDFIDKVVKLFWPNIQLDIIRTNTGFKSIGKMVKECSETGEVLMGCEEAIGGLFLPNISLEKDGFQQTLLTMYMIGFYKLGAGEEPLKTDNRKLISQLYWLMWKTGWVWLGKTVPFTITQEKKNSILKKLVWLSDHEKPFQLERFQLKAKKGENEGIFKFSLSSCPESWIKARFSGTEPKFKLYFNLYTNISELKEKEANNWEKIIREKRASLDYTIQLLTKLLEKYLLNDELVNLS